MTQIVALIVAAGRGTRAGEGVPKQFRPAGGRPLILHSLSAFLAHSKISAVQAVIHCDDEGRYREAVAGLGSPERLLAPVPGGATRQESVRAGLEALAKATAKPDLVLVHDAARPFVGGDLIDRAVAAGLMHSAAVPGIPVSDTIKLVDRDERVEATPERARLRAVQTPQAFRFDLLLEAHRKAAAERGGGFTDDGALAEWAGLPVHVFPGDERNTKVTAADDLIEAERRLGGPLTTCVGLGYDVHAFADGDHLWLGGVKIAHERGVEAHSDGDVVLHALTDALLGALAEDDIGAHFPPSDRRWKNVSSDRFLAFAVERVKSRGGLIDHLDVTIVCEAPRIAPHREAMRDCISALAGIPRSRVSIKATTSERLGFAGRGEGLSAHAIASVRLPPVDARG